ncbi:uncharacterized protein LOC128961247 [Oppia nitens]|uniref:uncharacterized protein LOC128961247 n=1 Tax=Oppia nitens TaxID=1686743 RepID=UPI0023DC9BB8|nr:uncharacterized protein LOC128961247 [Oppia nitens]
MDNDTDDGQEVCQMTKQKKRLLKIVGKLYKVDLTELCDKFSVCKSGNKVVIRNRIIDLINEESKSQNDNKWIDIRKNVKKVYKNNDKIKKSPKKSKKKKKKIVSETPSKSQSNTETVVNNENSNSQTTHTMSSTQQSSSQNNSTPNATITSQNPVVNPFPAHQPVNGIPSTSHTINGYSTHPLIMAPQPPLQSQPLICPPLRPPPLVPPSQMVSHNYYNSQNPHNNHFHPNFSSQPLNYSFNNIDNNNIYHGFSGPTNSTQCQQNNETNYPNFDSEFANPQSFDALIKQQKILFDQFSTSKQEMDVNNINGETTDSYDLPEQSLMNFEFKCLPKFNVIKNILEPKTIGSLSDIGVTVEFKIDLCDVQSNNMFIRHNSYENDLQKLLTNNCYQIQLRFSYINDINTRQQKDVVPEYLCIECNNKLIFASDQVKEQYICPINLSDDCIIGTNRVRFWMSKEKYTFLMPCLYEISLVKYETPETFLAKLKANPSQFLISDITKQLIKSRHESQSQDDIIINIANTSTKVKLICPLSCCRLETPCRTNNCKHIECFDAFSFFKANEYRYDWICPICQKEANFDSLRVDGFFTDVLYHTDNDITEIFVKSNATYDIQNVTAKCDSPLIIELDDEEDTCDFSVVEDADGCIVID